MIKVFMIVTGKDDNRVTGCLFARTPETTARGHQYKIFKKRYRLDQRTQRKHFFTSQIVLLICGTIYQCTLCHPKMWKHIK